MLTTMLCCFVVMIHLTSNPVSQLTKGGWTHLLFFIGNKVLTFAVPGFVFLSGLKLSYSYRNKTFDFVDFMRRRFSKILIPYSIGYILYYIFFRLFGFVEVKNITQHIYSFLLGDLVAPFYFITIITQFYFLFGIIQYLFKKGNHTIILAITTCIQLFYLQYTYFQLEDRFFLTYLIYFVLGCYVAFHLDAFKDWLNRYTVLIFGIFFLISVVYVTFAYCSAVYATPFPYWRIIGCLFSLSAICTFYRISVFITHFEKYKLYQAFIVIDEASYMIFLSHCFMIYLCDVLWHSIGIPSVLSRFLFTAIITYPVVFSVCIGYCRLKRKK